MTSRLEHVITVAVLLGRKQSGPEGTVMCRGEIGFLRQRRRNERLEIAGDGVEFLPEGHARTIGGSKFSEVGPIVLHGARELQLLGAERRPRHSDGQREEILQLGSVGRGVRERNRRQKILRRVLVLELIGGERNELRHREVGAQGRTGENDVRASRGESNIRGRKTGEGILRGDQRSRGSDQGSEGCFVRGLIVGDGPGGGEIEIKRGEEPPFIVIAALDHRHMVELAGGERGIQREREKLSIDVGRVSSKIFVGQDGGDGKRTQAGRGLSAAARCSGECLAGSLSGVKGLRVQRVSAAFDDGFVKEAFRGRRGELREDAEAPRRFAEDGHVPRIAAEEPNVVADPAESELLVHEAVVTGGIGIAIAVAIRICVCPGKGGMGEKAESTETVIDGHDDDPVLNQGGGIVVVAFTKDEGAAMDPNHHRARAEEIVGVRSENIQEEAILRNGRDTERRGWLRAVVSKLRGLERREPWSVRNRRAPAQIAHRRRGVRNAEELTEAGRSDGAADGTAEGEDQR